MLLTKDRVKELVSSTGTTTLSLSGAESGFQAFSVLGNNTSCNYTIVDVNSTAWEVGRGVYNSNTLTRDEVFESSTGGSKISLSATGSTVFLTYPGSKAAYNDIGVNRNYVASSSITAGKPLILNADNTVSQVAESTTGQVTEAITSAVNSNNPANKSLSATDGNGTIVQFYAGTSGNPTIQAGTISGTTITWGTAVITQTQDTDGFFLYYDPQGYFVTGSRTANSGQEIRCFTYTVSGTALTQASFSTLTYSETGHSNLIGGYHKQAQKGLLVSIVSSGTNRTFMNTLTVASNGSMTFGSTATDTYRVYSTPQLVYNDEQQCLMLYASAVVPSGGGDWYQPSVMCFTISGSTPSMGTPVQIATSGQTGEYGYLIYHAESKKTLAFYEFYDGSSQIIHYQVVGISGTTVTAGTSTYVGFAGKVSSAIIEYTNIGLYDPFTKKIGMAYVDGTTLKIRSATLTNDSLAFDGEVTPGIDPVYNVSMLNLNSSDSKTFLIASQSNQQTKYNVWTIGSAGVTSSNLTTDNYFGIASTTASTTEPVGVNRAGSFNNDQTGMTAGKDMYVTDAGLIKERTTTTTTQDTTLSQSSNNRFDYASLSGQVSIAYDTVNNKIGVLARNYNSYPAVTIGEESNNSITWGTPVVVNSSTDGSSNRNRLAYGNGIFVAIFTAGNTAKMKAGTVSGDSISFGSDLTPSYSSITANQTNVSYNPNANKFIFAKNVNNSTSVDLWIVSNSGSTLSVASSSADATITNAGNDYRVWTNIYDPDTNKTIIGVDNYVGSNYGKLYPVTISGSSLSVSSTPYSMTGGAYEDYSDELIYDSTNNKWLLLQCNETSNYINGTVLTASGDTFTAGTKTVLSSDPARYLGSYYDTVKEKFIIGYQYYTTGYYGKFGEITISGTTPSWTTLSGTILNQTAERVFPKSALFNPDTNHGILAGTFNMSTDDGMAIVLYYSSTTTTVVNGSQFVGTARSGTDLELSEPPTELVGYSESAITKGRAVIVKPDGNYAQAGLTTTSVTNTGTASQGSLGNMGTYSQDMFAMAVASDGVTYCFTYQNTSSQQACKIGTRSGETISWGSELVLASGSSGSHFVSYDASANVFLTTYTTGNLVKGTAVSYSGNTGTKGAEVTIMDLGNSSGNPSFNYKHWYDSTNKVTVCWAKGGVSGNDTNRSSAVALTLTGTSISVGTLFENTSAGGQNASGCDITGGKHVLYWTNSSQYPTVMIMSVSSTGDITWGTPVTNNSNSGSFATPIYNSNFPDKCIVAGKFTNYNSYFSYFGVTVIGTSITISNFLSGNINSAQSYVESGGSVAVYSNYSGNYCFVYQTYGNYNSRYNFATTTDGLSLTVATAVTTTSHGSNQFYAGACASDVDGVVVENHNDRSSSPGYYSYYCFNPTFNFTSTTQVPNMTSANVIGIAQETILANNDIKVKTFGQVDENQSSLTTGSAYFVNGTTGAIQTTADDPSVNIGTALNSTNLLIKS